MWRHTKDYHSNEIVNDNLKPTRFIQVQLEQNNNNNNNLSLNRKIMTKLPIEKQKLYDNCVLDMIIDDMLPLNTVEKTGFQKLVATLKPGYVLPSRGKVDDLIQSRFMDRQKSVMELCQLAKFPSYTADLWKSIARQYFLSVSLHFIDDDWKLHSVLICTTYVTGNHKKDRIGKIVAEKIHPFLGKSARVHSGVTDGGEIASIKFTEQSLPHHHRYINKIESRFCLCHQLNNVIKRILSLYFGPFLNEWRAFISRINFSNSINELFISCKLQVFGQKDKKRLQKDCETRWSSTAMMLRKAEQFRKVVSLMLVEASQEMKEHIPKWSNEDWQLLSNLNNLLLPSIEVIKTLEGDSYPTQNIILMAMHLLVESIKDLKKNFPQESFFSKLLTDFEHELDKVWQSLPQETLIAAIVDPRFKSLNHVPVTEHEEAWNCLKEEFYSPPFFDKSIPIVSDVGTKEEKVGQKRKREDVLTIYGEKIFKQNEMKNEYERYKEMSSVHISLDPLEWWRDNEGNYPVISQIAKVYLAIPASQATCERSFSISRRICSESRSSLTPEHVEQLTLLKNNNNEMYEYETQKEFDQRNTENGNETTDSWFNDQFQ